MKKVLFIMTMLVVAMGVSFTTNAQTTVQVYNSYDYNSISDWTDTYEYGAQQSTLGSGDMASFAFNLYYYSPAPGVYEGTVTLEQGFDMSNLDSINISFDVSESTTLGSDYSFDVSLSNDNGVTYTSVYTENVTGSSMNNFTITNNTLFATSPNMTYVKIAIFYDNPSVVGPEQLMVDLNDFSIEGYESTTSVGIYENDLSDNLDIYSYNKSVFLSSNENINANVTVYNMSGQVVINDSMNISSNKTELNFNYLRDGIYLIKVFDTSSNKHYQTKILLNL